MVMILGRGCGHAHGTRIDQHHDGGVRVCAAVRPARTLRALCEAVLDGVAVTASSVLLPPLIVEPHAFLPCFILPSGS